MQSKCQNFNICGKTKTDDVFIFNDNCKTAFLTASHHDAVMQVCVDEKLFARKWE
jgi:hypothetical protein